MQKVALVTGGTSGIGLELVRQLAERGVRVLATGSRPEQPRDLAALADVAYFSCDLATELGVRSLTQWTGDSVQQLDLLFNNAGIQIECRIGPELARHQIEREVAINLTAPIHLTSALLPLVEAANGCIVNVSSGLAIFPKAASPVYCSTKAGLSSFSQSLRYQTEGTGVRVVDVITPLVKTPMTEGRHKGAIAPSDFVRQVLAQVDAGRNEIWVGKAKVLRVLRWLAPSIARKTMRGKPTAAG